MSDTAADSPPPQGERWLAGPKPSEGWSRKHFFFLLAIVIVLHVALVIIFGTKKPVLPKMREPNVPHLQLANDGNELIALGDPTLFARPNLHDQVSAFWRRTPQVKQPDFNWTETPVYLAPAPQQFGAEFREFMQTNQPAELAVNFKPEPKATWPALALDQILPETSRMHISGELARRPLLTPVTVPTLPLNDAIAPSRVQALVAPAGNVASAVLLPPDSALEAAGGANIGDSNALAITRSLRFAPAPGLTFGEILFQWHTVPVTATNKP